MSVLSCERALHRNYEIIYAIPIFITGFNSISSILVLSISLLFFNVVYDVYIYTHTFTEKHNFIYK